MGGIHRTVLPLLEIAEWFRPTSHKTLDSIEGFVAV